MTEFKLKFNSEDTSKRDARGRPLIYLPLKIKILINNHLIEGENEVSYFVDKRILVKVVINGNVVYDANKPEDIEHYKQLVSRLGLASTPSTTRTKREISKESIKPKNLREIKGWK